MVDQILDPFPTQKFILPQRDLKHSSLCHNMQKNAGPAERKQPVKEHRGTNHPHPTTTAAWLCLLPQQAASISQKVLMERDLVEITR